MNKEEISTILTQSGVGGLEKEIKKAIFNNDKWWFLIVFLIAVSCSIMVMVGREPVVIDNSKEVKEFCDSLQYFVDTSMYVEGFKGR